MALMWYAERNLPLFIPVQLLLVFLGEEVFVSSQLGSINVGVLPAGIIRILLCGCTTRHQHNRR